MAWQFLHGEKLATFAWKQAGSTVGRHSSIAPTHPRGTEFWWIPLQQHMLWHDGTCRCWVWWRGSKNECITCMALGSGDAVGQGSACLASPSYQRDPNPCWLWFLCNKLKMVLLASYALLLGLSSELHVNNCVCLLSFIFTPLSYWWVLPVSPSLQLTIRSRE